MEFYWSILQKKGGREFFLKKRERMVMKTITNSLWKRKKLKEIMVKRVKHKKTPQLISILQKMIVMAITSEKNLEQILQ